MNKQLSDEEIIAAIQADGRLGDAALKQVYLENRAAIDRMVLRLNGNSEEAKDVMQEAILSFLENIRSGRFKGESKISTYFFSIARFTWLNKQKKKGREEEKKLGVKKENDSISHTDVHFISPSGLEEMVILFGRLGEDCRRVLIDSIYYGRSMHEIAKKRQYQNEQVARNKKYTCLLKLKKLVREHPHLINWLNKEP